MQLLILTNRGTCSDFKALNEEIILSSHRISTGTKNKNYKQVCKLEIRGRYVKSKTVVDEDVVSYMRDSLKEQVEKTDQKPEFHTCLNVYAHDGTFGLRRTKIVSENYKKAVIRPKQFVGIITDYLIEHPECTVIKLRVCFSGSNYQGAHRAYADMVAEELEHLMNADIIPQDSITVHGSNGWSILVRNKDDFWSHRVLPSTEELLGSILNNKGVDNSFIMEHALVKHIGQPTWTAIREID